MASASFAAASILMQILDISAKLTDEQKIAAEFFDDKLVSLAAYPVFLAAVNGWDTHKLLASMMAMNCVYDATLLCWKEKVRFGALRPVSLVRHFYGDKSVKAYGGR